MEEVGAVEGKKRRTRLGEKVIASRGFLSSALSLSLFLSLFLLAAASRVFPFISFFFFNLFDYAALVPASGKVRARGGVQSA